MTPDIRTAAVATAAVPNREATTAPTVTVASSVATAEQRRKRIGLILDGMIGQQDKLLRLVSEAKDNQDHLALGFPSWPAYVTQEFGGRLAQLNPADRRSAVLALTETGMSTRAIAPIVGVSKSTVQNWTVEAPTKPDTVTSLDGRQRPSSQPAVTSSTRDDPWTKYFPDPQERADVQAMSAGSDEQFEEALAAARAQGDLSRANVIRNIPSTVVRDLAAASTKKSTGPKRRPLSDSCRDVAHDLHRITARVHLIAADDRLEKNRDVVAARLRHELGQAITAAQSLVDLLADEDVES